MNIPPDPEGMNNERAERAEKAIELYDDGEGDDNTYLNDLLADLMHWCDRHEVDFDHALRIAKDHYWAETQPEAEE